MLTMVKSVTNTQSNLAFIGNLVDINKLYFKLWFCFDCLCIKLWCLLTTCRHKADLSLDNQTVKIPRMTPLMSCLTSWSIIHYCFFKWPQWICLMWLNVLAGVWHGAGWGVLPPSEQEGESTDCPGAVGPHHLLPSCQIPWYTPLFFHYSFFSHISGCCKLFCRSQGVEFAHTLFSSTSYHPLPCHPPSNLLDTEEVTHRKTSSSISLWTLDILVFRSVPLPHRTPTETVIHSLPSPPMGKIGLLGCVVSPWASATTTTTTQGKFWYTGRSGNVFGMSGMS